MTHPCIITVAPTGNVPRKRHNPAVPESISEIVESVHASYEAGAAVAHVHVRDDEGNPCSDADRFGRLQEDLLKHCPDMIIQMSTGARAGKGTERGQMLVHNPEMASLCTGSVNFKTVIYENHPQLVETMAAQMLQRKIKPEIEIFDLAMLYAAADMVKRGELAAPVHVQFVMGIPNALPAQKHILQFLIQELEANLPGATWTGAGVGRHQVTLHQWAIELGGHIRAGLEDSIQYDASRLATSNAELVGRAADMINASDRKVATPAEARQLLNLPLH